MTVMENTDISSDVLVRVKGLRLLWEVTGVSAGSFSCCVELLHEGHVLAVAPGTQHTQLPFNALVATLKPHSNGPSYSNMVIGTLDVYGWAVTFGTARRGLGGLQPHPVPSLLYQM